jgi:hypothetical protein
MDTDNVISVFASLDKYNISADNLQILKYLRILTIFMEDIFLLKNLIIEKLKFFFKNKIFIYFAIFFIKKTAKENFIKKKMRDM